MFGPMFASSSKSPHPAATISKILAASQRAFFEALRNAPDPDF
jgi:hypothetical protein